mgnify:CR=1 FL=1
MLSTNRSTPRILGLSLAFFLLFSVVSATVSVPNLFTDHMVLQRDLENPVWGKAAPDEAVTVAIAGQQRHEYQRCWVSAQWQAA